MDSSDSDTADSEWNRQSMCDAVPKKRKKVNEKDRSPNADVDLRKFIEARTSAQTNETESASCSGLGKNIPQEDQPLNDNGDDISENPRWDTKEVYPGRGLKDTLHGITHQLKHLVLTLYHAWQKGYRFRLATELGSAEKFDDVVLEFEDSEGTRMHRFIQLKHRQDGSMQITANDLLKKDTEDFSVQKYFTSWGKIKNHQDFVKSKSKCFILCTNIGLNESKLNDQQIGVIPLKDFDDFLKITDAEKQGSCYKLQAAENTELFNKLEHTSEVHQLANELAKCVNDSTVNNSNVISLQENINKQYYAALARELLDVNARKRNRSERKPKFTDAFIRNIELSSGVEKFRKIFFMYLKKNSSYKNASDEDICTNLKEKLFAPYQSFGESTTNLPNDYINDFLDEFILAVKQPDELKLSKTIKRVFGEYSLFNLSNTDFIADSFQTLILDWFKQKQGVYFVSKDIEKFFKEMEHKISSLIAVGINMHYLSELKKYDVQFKREVEGLRTFLDTSESTENLIWQVISCEQTMLTALRIYQTLHQLEEYRKDDSFIFVKLKHFLRTEITGLVFLAFLSSGSQHLLAVDCGLDSTRQDMEQLRNNVTEIMTKLHKDNITGKRIILILPEKDARNIQLEQQVKTIYEKEDDISIDNIETATQQRLLRKKVIRLQGREQQISFVELFGIDNFDGVVEENLAEYRQMMSPKTLVKLIHGEELGICAESEAFGVPEYYIDRKIDTRVVINVRILMDPKITDVFAISGIVAEALEKLLTDEKIRNKISDRNHLANYVILEKGREKEHFDSLCETKNNLHIHWFQREHDKFIWMRSSKNSTNLLGYREETRCDGECNDERGLPLISEEQLADYDEQRGVVILSDTAGMGKSTVLARLAEKIIEKDPCLLVIKIDLNNHTTNLAAEERKRSFHSNDVKGAVDFLVDKLICNAKREDVLFLKTIIKVQRKVTILFDGFDEISPCFKETVIDLLEALVKLEVKQLFVTTRPHTSRALEEKLGAFSYTLLPFSAANQMEFLTKFWETGFIAQNPDSCSSEKRDSLQEHARSVIELLAKSIDSSMKEFTGVPLQTRLVAEVFPFEGSPLPKRITITKIYNQFVDKKYDVYRQEKQRVELRNQSIESSRKRDLRGFIEMHEKLALNLLFDKTTVVKRLPKKNDDLNETLEDMLKDGQKAGIVVLQKDGQFRFIHRTFAEYFAATFLTKILRKGGCNRTVQGFFVGQLFVQPEYRVIRAFSNCLLVAKNVPLEGDFWEFDLSEHRNTKGDTAYHVAAEERHGGIATFLSNNVRERHGTRFSNINCLSTGYKKNTPLIAAVQMTDNFDVVKCLIEHHADINSRDSEDATPLHRAAQSGNLDLVKYLAERGADIHSQTKDGETPLHLAARSGKVDLAKYLADRGANIHSQTKDGETPLHLAAQSDNLDLVKYLAERGADIHSQTKDGETPLSLAAFRGNLDMAKYLADRGANIHSQTKDGETPLHLAARSGNLDLVKYLAERGADIHSQAKDGETPLHLAAQSGKLDLAKYLAERGADIHSQTIDGETPLHLAAESDNLDLVKYLAERGADIHSQTKDGETPLHLAVQSSNLDLAKYLAERGADIHSQTKDGVTPLHLAARSGKLDLAKYLAERGADIHSQTIDGETPLHLAAQSDNLDLVKYLAERGADIHSQTKDGKTPLHLAALSGYLHPVKYLAERGADMNSRTKDGETLQQYAAKNGYLDLVQYLAKKQADVQMIRPLYDFGNLQN